MPLLPEQLKQHPNAPLKRRGRMAPQRGSAGRAPMWLQLPQHSSSLWASGHFHPPPGSDGAQGAVDKEKEGSSAVRSKPASLTGNSPHLRDPSTANLSLQSQLPGAFPALEAQHPPCLLQGNSSDQHPSVRGPLQHDAAPPKKLSPLGKREVRKTRR